MKIDFWTQIKVFSKAILQFANFLMVIFIEGMKNY